MRVLRVIPSMNPTNGGPCQGVRNTIHALSMHAVRNDVVCLDDPSNEFIRREKFPIYALGEGGRKWAYSRRLVSWLRKNIRNYDLVVVHGIWLHHTVAVRKVLQELSRKKNPNLPKIVIMPHGMLDPWFQKHPSRRFKAFRNLIYWWLIECRNIRHADALWFTCQEELVLAKSSFKGYKPKREVNVGYGIQKPPPFHESLVTRFLLKCPQLRQSKYLLCLSRLHPKKGIDLLINAYRILKSQRTQLPKLLVAGPGLQDIYGKYLRSLAAGDNDIVFMGMLEGDLKWGAFYGCEAFVLPSHQENFGIVCAEALACAKPLLITDKVNIWREIKEDGAGYVGSDTPEGMLDLLSRWITSDHQERELLRTNAARCFTSKYSIDVVSNFLLEEIDFVCAEKKSNEQVP